MTEFLNQIKESGLHRYEFRGPDGIDELTISYDNPKDVIRNISKFDRLEVLQLFIDWMEHELHHEKYEF